MKPLLLSLLAAATVMLAQQARDTHTTRPDVGDVAPTFRLNDQSGHAVRIAPPKQDEQGHWTVLAFFPKAATPG